MKQRVKFSILVVALAGGLLIINRPCKNHWLCSWSDTVPPPPAPKIYTEHNVSHSANDNEEPREEHSRDLILPEPSNDPRCRNLTGNHRKITDAGARDLDNVFGGHTRVPDYIPSIPVGSAAPRIPHIIHQTWDSPNVPTSFAPYMKSWTSKHPDWEYWFWTPTEVRRLVEKHYPEYLDMYNNFPKDILRANIMRFMVMYKYGGVYADLDLESLRPLDNWTMDNDCVMSLNNLVHPYLHRKSAVAEVMITMLASRPGHLYFKLAVDMLMKSYQGKRYGVQVVYCERVYREYLKTNESQLPGNGVTVVHPDYFLPTYDTRYTDDVRRLCSDDYKICRDPQQEEMCVSVNDDTEGLRPKSYSYTTHYWAHVMRWHHKDTRESLDIGEIIPKYVRPKV